MKRSHTSKVSAHRIVSLKGEGPDFLYKNKKDVDHHFFDFLDTSGNEVTEEIIIEYFAQIIGDIFLEKTYGDTSHKKSSNLL